MKRLELIKLFISDDPFSGLSGDSTPVMGFVRTV